MQNLRNKLSERRKTESLIDTLFDFPPCKTSLSKECMRFLRYVPEIIP